MEDGLVMHFDLEPEKVAILLHQAKLQNKSLDDLFNEVLDKYLDVLIAKYEQSKIE